MTTRRIGKLPPQRFDKLKGGWLCRNCGKLVPQGRRSWCNRACEQEAGIKAWPSMARDLVFKRDHGVCAKCGIDANALDDAIRQMEPHPQGWMHYRWEISRERRRTHLLYLAFLKANGLRYQRSHWEAHHKHAVIEGGGECGLDGYETLCWRCHPKETGHLRRRLHRKKVLARPTPLFAGETE